MAIPYIIMSSSFIYCDAINLSFWCNKIMKVYLISQCLFLLTSLNIYFTIRIPCMESLQLKCLDRCLLFRWIRILLFSIIISSEKILCYAFKFTIDFVKLQVRTWSQHCQNTVTTLSQHYHNTVTTLSQHYHKTITTLSQCWGWMIR